MADTAKITITAPVSVQQLQPFLAGFVVQNMGPLTWQAGVWKLGVGSADEPNDDTWLQGHRIELPSMMLPGEFRTINATLRCTQSGSVRLRAKMVKENDYWLEKASDMTIAVSPAPPQPVVFPTPSPDPDCLVTAELWNTDAQPVDKPPVVLTWKNETGKRLLVRHVRIWAGLGVGQQNDVDGQLRQLGNRSMILHYQEDHYSQRNTSDCRERYFAADEKLIIAPGDGFEFAYFANTVIVQPKPGKVHFIVGVSVQFLP